MYRSIVQSALKHSHRCLHNARTARMQGK